MIENLEPRYVWGHFDKIRQIPRPSKHEEKIREHLLAWANERGFETRTDKVGNTVVAVPASKGHEKAPILVLQAHMDMVHEKNADVKFDFSRDPIQLRTEGDWLYARGTTLGADNGIGMASAMAIADDPEAVHGPIEILITVDEETGLTGAMQLDPSMVKGRRLTAPPFFSCILRLAVKALTLRASAAVCAPRRPDRSQRGRGAR